MTVLEDSRQALHVARQPVLDRYGCVFGYELLYRAHAADTACTADGNVAASRVLTDAILDIGLDTLTGGAPAFINFTKQLVVDGAARLLPVDQVVIELREDIVVDAEVIDACRELHASGYALALDDFVDGLGAEALLPYVRYVKLDVLQSPDAAWKSTARRLAKDTNVRAIAERVETTAIATDASAAGCTLFQGNYFCRPATQSVKAIPGRRLAYLNLFAALRRDDLTVAQLTDLIKRDVSITLRVLRSVNSAAFALSTYVTTVERAVMLLGVEHLRKWASIWAMAGANGARATEVVVIALLRARACEMVGEAYRGAALGAELFVAGMCSMLDVMLDQPMERAIASLPLTPAVRDALLGEAGEVRSILDVVIAHERGEWDRAEAGLQEFGLPDFLLCTVYADALRWAQQFATAAAA